MPKVGDQPPAASVVAPDALVEMNRVNCPVCIILDDELLYQIRCKGEEGDTDKNNPPHKNASHPHHVGLPPSRTVDEKDGAAAALVRKEMP